MRTIKKNLLYRLLAQAEEADLQGLTKVSESLTTQITKNAETLRDSDESYIYPKHEFQKEIEEKFWDIMVRAADFYNINLDAQEAQLLIEKYAEDLTHDMQVKFAIKHGVGAYEPMVPGEAQDKILVEVMEKEDINV
jgi:hypothetical protein